jgi:hypothetical protein
MVERVKKGSGGEKYPLYCDQNAADTFLKCRKNTEVQRKTSVT